MEQIRYEIIVEAVSPIAHASGTIGNVSTIMDRSVRLPDGSFVRVPIVTGDAMRHQMREAITYALLDAAGLLAGDGPGLSAAALRLLFNGGMLTGRGNANAVKLDEWRGMMDALPSLRLFGGCANNHMIPGQLSVSDALLICEETKHLVPAWTLTYCTERGVSLAPYRSHVDEEMRVRFDPTLRPDKRRLLEAGERDAVERRLIASEAAHAEDDDVARKATKSTMLPRTAEVIAAGSLFAWDVTATVYSDLDRDTLHVALGTFLANARVGGKSGTGHGRIRAVAGNRVALARPREAAESVDMSALASRVGDVFKAHVRDNAERLRSVLSTVDA